MKTKSETKQSRLKGASKQNIVENNAGWPLLSDIYIVIIILGLSEQGI